MSLQQSHSLAQSWFVKSNTKDQYSQQQINQATKDIHKYPKTHECYVPDKK